jgi:hypothetical protein
MRQTSSTKQSKHLVMSINTADNGELVPHTKDTTLAAGACVKLVYDVRVVVMFAVHRSNEASIT